MLSETMPLAQIEEELARQFQWGKEGEAPVRRARMSNLIIFTNSTDQAEGIAQVVPEIVSSHPARVLLLIGEPGLAQGDITAGVNVWCQLGHNQKICSEQITLRAAGSRVEHLPYAVRTLLIGDLPTNLFWMPPTPPPLAGTLLYDLSERVQQVIYDSNGWLEPARGVVATAAWLQEFQRADRVGWRVAADLNWRRLKFWRRLLSQALDPAATPGAVESVTEVLIEHGPHAVVQAWELMSWLAARLDWQVLGGRVQPGVELTWRAAGRHGPLGLRIRRLAEGPSEIRRLRIACTLDGRPSALSAAGVDVNRLAVVQEGSGTAPRTVTVQPQSLAELISRQLSDREYDPVFYESMAVAQVFAKSVLA